MITIYDDIEQGEGVELRSVYRCNGDCDWSLVLEDATDAELEKFALSIPEGYRNRYYTTDVCGDEINLDEFLSEEIW